jgi:rhomboid-like protein
MSYYQGNSYRRNSFYDSIPPVTRNLLIINAGVFLLCLLIKPLEFYLALFNYDSGYFNIYQLVTYMFAHASFDHIFFNMFALFMFGGVLENYW